MYSRYLGNEEIYEEYDGKNCFGARALPRAAHAKTHIAVNAPNTSNYGLGGRIFYRCARGSARAPKRILPSYSS